MAVVPSLQILLASPLGLYENDSGSVTNSDIYI